MLFKPTRQPGKPEFIALTSMLMATMALSIDIVLPGLGQISNDLSIPSANDRQWMVTMIFAGLTVALMVFGPLSDAIGRRPTIFFGIGVFALGGVMCTFATSYEVMLLGRFLQGVGAAAPRIVTVAMVRDRYKGEEMARIMSFGITLFIMVPIFAPSLGQALLWLAPWRVLFMFMTVVAMLVGTWLALRQPETLRQPIPFSGREFLSGCREVLGNRKTVAYMIAAGICTGPLIAYLNASQQIFQDLYQTGDLFVLFFSGSAAAIAAAGLVNARLVRHFGMEPICRAAISALTLASLGAVGLIALQGHDLTLWQWQTYSCLCLFLAGMTFGNFNAIMLEPVGHIAGLASAVTASIGTLISLLIGVGIGLQFDMSTGPMVVGYLSCGVATLLCIALAESRTARQEG